MLEKKATLVRLPCGYGKTLIGLIPFLAQAVDGQWDIAPRLIYVLPMRTLTNEVQNIACKMVKILKLAEPIIVKTLHGEALQTPHLFSDISVTTLDSFLYSYARKASINSPYGDKHVDFSAGSIANSMIVFDEAHMYQGGEVQVLGLFRLAIKYLVKLGIPVVIMTATMPKIIRDFLFKDISYDDISFKDDEKLYDKKYTVLPPESRDILDVGARNVISTLTYKKLLIVVNTVEKAIQISNELRKYDPILLHARMRCADKEDRINKVKKRLNEGQVILISTQVCEAGLDLDFDTLVTDVAPADSLVQRIGRVARKGGHGVVLFYKPRYATPYEDAIVDETWKWIEAHASEVDFSRFLGSEEVRGVQEFVDESWTSYWEKLDKRRISESELFFMGKGLVSEPDLDFNVRGTHYIILLAPYNGGKSLLNKGVIGRKEFDACKFTVDLDMVRRHKEWVEHREKGGAVYKKLSFRSESNGYAVELVSKLEPYQAYLVNSYFYSDEFGLRTLDK
jgi:CRISPR-associated helicase Cas3